MSWTITIDLPGARGHTIVVHRDTYLSNAVDEALSIADVDHMLSGSFQITATSGIGTAPLEDVGEPIAE